MTQSNRKFESGNKQQRIGQKNGKPFEFPT